MSLGWIICINMIIGIPIYFIGTVVFYVIEAIKYGDDIVDEVMERLRRESDNIYSTMVNDKRIMYAISFILTFVLWEIVLVMLFGTIHANVKELYKIRKSS